jgi:hypothetical protein
MSTSQFDRRSSTSPSPATFKFPDLSEDMLQTTQEAHNLSDCQTTCTAMSVGRRVEVRIMSMVGHPMPAELQADMEDKRV